MIARPLENFMRLIVISEEICFFFFSQLTVLSRAQYKARSLGTGQARWTLETRKMLAAKLNGVHVTEASLSYHCSSTLDLDQCHKAGILLIDSWRSGTRTLGREFQTMKFLATPGDRGGRRRQDNATSCRGIELMSALRNLDRT